MRDSKGRFIKGAIPHNKYLKSRQCIKCGNNFQPREVNYKYCSNKCRLKVNGFKKGQSSWNIGKAFGLLQTIFYKKWVGMKRRCQNKNDKIYLRYGAKGILVCKNWQTFEGFYKDMYFSYKDGLKLDRIDNNKGYLKENCRWVTQKKQVENRRITLWIEYKGIRDTLMNWANYFKINYKVLWARLYRSNWSIEKALFFKNGGGF